MSSNKTPDETDEQTHETWTDPETGEVLTTEYGIRVAETALHRSWRQEYTYWTPSPNTPEEAIEKAAEEFDEVLSSVDEVLAREVPAPEAYRE